MVEIVITKNLNPEDQYYHKGNTHVEYVMKNDGSGNIPNCFDPR